MNLLTIRNGSISYFVQNERYAFSGDFCVRFLSKSVYRFCYFAVSSTLSAKENGCQIHPSWRPPGKSSSVGNASPQTRAISQNVPRLRAIQKFIACFQQCQLNGKLF